MNYLTRGLQLPDREAVTDGAGAWTYAELLQHSECVAAALRGPHGVQGGDRVGLFLQRRRESVAQLLGAFGVGGVVTPFSVRGTAREMAHQIVDAGITQIVSEKGYEAVIQEAVARAGEQGVTPRVIEGASLLSATATRADLNFVPDAAALILYTSGTTGLPKGVVHTHASLMAQVASLAEAWEWSAEDRLLHVLPLHHIHGLVNGLLGTLWGGAGLRFREAFEATEVWKAFVERQCSVFYSVPTIYHQLLASWDKQEVDVQRQWAQGAAQLRLAVSGSAALPAQLWNRWREITGQALLERYGMTEIGMALSNPYRGDRRPGSVGQALPGMRFRIVTDAGEDAPEGVPGEIWIQGPTLFREYWNKPDATRAAFRDGYFLTGDVAEMQNGAVCIRGRASVDILKSAGYKISALEIEEVLRELPDLQDVAVVGVPDAEWGEIITACVVPQRGASLTLEQIRSWCQDKLASYKVPRRLVLQPELPRNAMGKVTKPDLIKQLLGGG